MGNSQLFQGQQAKMSEQRMTDYKAEQDVLDEKVDDKDLQAIASDVASKWKVVAENLGLTKAKIYEIEADNFGPTGGARESCLQMLYTWKNMLGNDAKKGVLYKALCEAGMKDQAGALKASNR